MAIQESQLATQLLVHAKRLNGSPEATLQLFDLFKPPTHQRMPLSGDFGLEGGGRLGGGQYLLGGGQLLALVRQLRARIFTLWKALLLGRRVLFYAPPPVGRLCERALSAHQLQAGWAACCALHAAPRTAPLRASPVGHSAQRPTQRPTDRPTPRPTQRPTHRPTPRPTQRPTQSPAWLPLGTGRASSSQSTLQATTVPLVRASQLVRAL